MSADTIIRDARILDGSCAPAFEADVLLQGGRFADIRKFLAVGGSYIIDA